MAAASGMAHKEIAAEAGTRAEIGNGAEGGMAAAGDPAVHHLGHLILESMRSRSSGDLFQIDAATGEQETVGSVLSRSVRLARALRRLGLRPGDVLALAGRNHLHLRIPYYAAMMNGLPVVGIDQTFKITEIQRILEATQPAIIFCDADSYDTYKRITEDLSMAAKIYIFDGVNTNLTMSKLMLDGETNSDADEAANIAFRPADFDTDKIYAWLVSTSGTTGIPKLAAYKHDAIIQTVEDFKSKGLVSPKKGPRKIGFNISPVEWISSYFNALLMPLMNLVLLQTSKINDMEHFVDVINKYKPSTMAISPSMLRSILHHEKHCDFKCFDSLTISGEKVFMDMLAELQSRTREDAKLKHAYGQTEILGPVFLAEQAKGHPLESCGVPWHNKEIKLVDLETRETITEPQKHGELLVKGPLMSEYYKNPKETAQAFTPDGWYKTGDLMYRDERDNYYFVERAKMVIKYRNSQVLPLEIEKVIITHPGVRDVGVTAIPSTDDGEHPVAVVVLHPGASVTPQAIKDLVAEKMSDKNKLRGGVIFVEALPLTGTGKVARQKVKEIAMATPSLLQ